MTDDGRIPGWFEEYARDLSKWTSTRTTTPAESTEEQKRRLAAARAELERLRGKYYPDT